MSNILIYSGKTKTLIVTYIILLSNYFIYTFLPKLVQSIGFSSLFENFKLKCIGELQLYYIYTFRICCSCFRYSWQNVISKRHRTLHVLFFGTFEKSRSVNSSHHSSEFLRFAPTFFPFRTRMPNQLRNCLAATKRTDGERNIREHGIDKAANLFA